MKFFCGPAKAILPVLRLFVKICGLVLIGAGLSAGLLLAKMGIQDGHVGWIAFGSVGVLLVLVGITLASCKGSKARGDRRRRGQ